MTEMLDTATITVIVAGIIAVLGALVTGIVTIITALNEAKDKVVETKEKVVEATQTVKETTQVQNQKLDNITILVDGRYSAVLTELAEMKEMVARMTGAEADITSAEEARDASNVQERQVGKAKAQTDHE